MLAFCTGEILSNGYVPSSRLPGTIEKSHAQPVSFFTGTQVADAPGVALIGLVDAHAASGGIALHAFIVSLLAIVLLSVVLSLTVLPLAGPHPAATGKGAAVPARERAQESRDAEGKETIHSLEKGTCLSCPAV